jgi:hypothetical protein
VVANADPSGRHKARAAPFNKAGQALDVIGLRATQARMPVPRQNIGVSF